MAANFLRSLSQRFTKSKNNQQRGTTTTALSSLAQSGTSATTTTTIGTRQQRRISPGTAGTAETTKINGLTAAAATAVGHHSHQCQCRVKLLDQSELLLHVEKCTMGQELYDRVFAHMDLLEERDYFGLQFVDQFQERHWLDPAKRVCKQIRTPPPYTMRLRVKFFTNEPANLRDELTRYLFFLQLRQDIQTGAMECSREIAAQLAALALQSEHGDFNQRDHSSTPFVVQPIQFQFHPEQNVQMENAILQHWQNPELVGLSPSQAEIAYLTRAKQLLPMYGVDLHYVQGRDGCNYRLGLCSQGVLVLDGHQKIGLFLWEKIQRLDFRGRRLSLVVEEELPAQPQNGQLVQLHTFIFHVASSRACKNLWKCAIEFHTFFRLKHQRRHSSEQRRIFPPPLFRLGSTFRYRGRTEYETINRARTRAAAEKAAATTATTDQGGSCLAMTTPVRGRRGDGECGRGALAEQQTTQISHLRPLQRNMPKKMGNERGSGSNNGTVIHCNGIGQQQQGEQRQTTDRQTNFSTETMQKHSNNNNGQINGQNGIYCQRLPRAAASTVIAIGEHTNGNKRQQQQRVASDVVISNVVISAPNNNNNGRRKPMSTQL